MTKIKVGDVVKVVKTDMFAKKGDIGKVISVDSPEFVGTEMGCQILFGKKKVWLLYTDIEPVPSRDFQFEHEGRTIKFWNKNPIVLCEYHIKKDDNFYGYASCQPDDKFDFLEGMKRSLSKALEGMSIKNYFISALESAWKKRCEAEGKRVGDDILKQHEAQHEVDVAFSELHKAMKATPEEIHLFVSGFIADGRMFATRDGWKSPKAEMPKWTHFGTEAQIEFIYKGDKKKYVGYPSVHSCCGFWTTEPTCQNMGEDIRRSPDVIAWKYVK